MYIDKIKTYWHSLTTKQQLVIIITFAVLFNLIIQAGYFSRLFSSSLDIGIDATHHIAMLEKYRSEVYPNIFGWIWEWNLGQPWTVGYSPLYPWVMASLANLTGLSMQALVFTLMILSTLAVPIITALTSWRVYKNIKAVAISQLLIFLFINGSFSTQTFTGISVESNFEIGLVSQAVGQIFVLMVPLLFTLKNTRLRILLLVANITICSYLNLHNGIVAIAITFSCYTFSILWKKQYDRLLELTFMLAWVGVMLWPWISIVNDYRLFLLTKPLSTIRGDALLFGFLPTIILLGATWKTKVVDIISWSTALCALGIIFSELTIQAKLELPIPMQAQRYTAFILVLALIMLGNLLTKIRTNFYLVAMLVLASMLPNFQFVGIGKVGEYDATDKQLLEHLQNSNKRVLVENYPNEYRLSLKTTDTYQNHVGSDIAALTPLTGQSESVWGNFRESAFNSPFIQPLRNNFSTYDESFGVSCKFCPNIGDSNDTNVRFDDNYLKFDNQPMSMRLARAQMFGIDTIVLRSPKLVADMVGQTQWENTSKIGPWYVYDNTKPAKAFQINTNAVLTFTHIDNGLRTNQDYDWHSLNEGLFYHVNSVKSPLAMAQSDFIDELPAELKYFKTLLITDYRYKNLDAAIKTLDSYLNDNLTTIILLKEENSPLYDYFKNYNSDRIFNINKNPNLIEFGLELNKVINQAYLRQHAYDFNYYYQVDSAFKNDNQIVVKSSLSKPASTVAKTLRINLAEAYKYIALPYSYFPGWQSNNSGDKIYMGSPGFVMLVTPANSESTTLSMSLPAKLDSGNFATQIAINGSLFFAIFISVILYNKFGRKYVVTSRLHQN